MAHGAILSALLVFLITASEVQHFSGDVAETPPGKLVVTRTLPGKPPEQRTFLINSATKVEGKLAVGARVTVGFQETEEGALAVRIIVRPTGANKKK